jgi:uncharacterized protein DUF4339
MQIYVGKNGQQLGPFSLEEVNRKLADGTFAGTDLAWYEGAAGWAPLSGVAGVVIPTVSAASIPTPTAAPTPAPVVRPAFTAVQPPTTPVRPNTPIVQPARSPVRTLAIVSWALLGVSFLMSLIPFVGCGAWAFAAPVAIAAIIMGIIMLTRGATGHGIMVILGGALIVPLCFAGQFASLALLGSLSDSPKKLLILDNLRAIDTAKNDFAIKTSPANGATVTMASLTSYLNGKEIKPIVGETYDPKPIGQAATATLPANKTLGKLKAGETFTAEQLQKDIDNTFSWAVKSPTPATTPVITPLSSPKATVTPTFSAAASMTASPKPSVSPRPSSPPHLITPRQSVEPNDSPSSRPSPSAKFAPRVNPRRSPGPSEERSDSQSSGVPKQGRKNPRESPHTTPGPSPDDDDE